MAEAAAVAATGDCCIAAAAEHSLGRASHTNAGRTWCRQQAGGYGALLKGAVLQQHAEEAGLVRAELAVFCDGRALYGREEKYVQTAQGRPTRERPFREQATATGHTQCLSRNSLEEEEEEEVMMTIC